MEKTKAHLSPKTNVSQSDNTSKEVKGKGKIVSESKIPSKGSETHSNKVEKEVIKK